MRSCRQLECFRSRCSRSRLISWRSSQGKVIESSVRPRARAWERFWIKTHLCSHLNIHLFKCTYFIYLSIKKRPRENCEGAWSFTFIYSPCDELAPDPLVTLHTISRRRWWMAGFAESFALFFLLSYASALSDLTGFFFFFFFLSSESTDCYWTRLVQLSPRKSTCVRFPACIPPDNSLRPWHGWLSKACPEV